MPICVRRRGGEGTAELRARHSKNRHHGLVSSLLALATLLAADADDFGRKEGVTAALRDDATAATVVSSVDFSPAQPATTVVLMSDSREPAGVGGYFSLAVRLNRLYARRHGYAFHVEHTPCLRRDGGGRGEEAVDKVCACCAHETMGPRSASWCKLTSIMAAMTRFPAAERILFLDSDAFVWAQGTRVEAIFARFKARQVLGLPSNSPWSIPPGNAGVQFWRTTAAARKLLQQWWDFPVQPYYNLHHEYEQTVLVEGFLQQHAAEIRVIHQMRVMAGDKPLPSPRKLFIAHVCGAWMQQRVALMETALCVYEQRQRTVLPMCWAHKAMEPPTKSAAPGGCPCDTLTDAKRGWMVDWRWNKNKATSNKTKVLA